MKSAAQAMTFEQSGSMAISKKAAKKLEKTTDITRMTTGAILWYLVKMHKFALLATFTIVYVMFSLFGTLLVGLAESLVR